MLYINYTIYCILIIQFNLFYILDTHTNTYYQLYCHMYIVLSYIMCLMFSLRQSLYKFKPKCDFIGTTSASSVMCMCNAAKHTKTKANLDF